MAVFSFRPRPEARAELAEAIGFGLLNLGLALETRGKAHAPVHGGFRSFTPGAKPIGGTLRRSIHTVAKIGDKVIGRHADPDMTLPLPDYPDRPDPVVFVGSNSGYGLWVHNGTSKMAARPFLEEGLADLHGQEGAIIAAGARKHLGQS